MRVNCYAEELTDEVQIVTAQAGGHDKTFYGVRNYHHSTDKLHHSPLDDDRSAVTTWVPWTEAGGHDFEFLARIYDEMAKQLRETAAQLELEKESVSGSTTP